MRDVIITPALNGWIVKVGCATVVFENLEPMLNELRRYVRTPERVEKEYLANAQNQMTGTNAGGGIAVEEARPEARTRAPHPVRPSEGF